MNDSESEKSIDENLRYVCPVDIGIERLRLTLVKKQGCDIMLKDVTFLLLSQENAVLT